MSKETYNSVARQILVVYYFVVFRFLIILRQPQLNAGRRNANGYRHLPDAEEKPRSR